MSNLEDLLNKGEENKKEAHRQYMRKYKVNMTESQKEARNQYQREYRANMTEEPKRSSETI